MNPGKSCMRDTVYEVVLSSETDSNGWRKAARKACASGIAPGQLVWRVPGQAEALNLIPYASLPEVALERTMRINKALLKEIDTALLHSDPNRFDLAYRLIWRSQAEPKIHQNPADPDVKKLYQLTKNIRRDIHKMHAFVRFRKIGENDGREQFVAWFEPEHHITAAVAPFFRNRFAGMDWLILTPECSIGWDGKNLSYGPGGNKSDVPGEDSIEDDWRSYYANIFNPARVKVQAMKSEMPMKYWRNLPEASLIPGLLKQAETKTARMIDQARDPQTEFPISAAPRSPGRVLPASIADLYHHLEQRADAPSEDYSAKFIRGEGPSHAELLFVGEQPGDQEDLKDRVFVGPAGQMLDRALADANIPRQQAFLTNAVKRFKYIRRGKRRIHQTPSSAEIEYYRWWVEQERRLVNPKLTVALGGSAAQSLLGKKITLSQYRGKIWDQGDNERLLITVHPSYLLRIPDQVGRDIEYQKFVRDLRLAKRACEESNSKTV